MDIANPIDRGFGPDPFPDDPWSWTRVIFRDIPDLPGYCFGSDLSLWSRKVGCPRRGKLSRRWRLLSPARIRGGSPHYYLRVAPGQKRAWLTVDALMATVFPEIYVPEVVPPWDLDPACEWRNIPGYPGYRATSSGDIWSCWAGIRNNRIEFRSWHRLSPTLNRRGYPAVEVKDESGIRHTRTVHRLVLLAFLGPCPEGMEACHYPDPDPTNNRIDNLRWDTFQANMLDRVIQGTKKGVRNGRHKLDDSDVREIRHLLSVGTTCKEVARRFGVSLGAIYFIRDGTTWSHIG
jgi:hypothetical protein